MSDKSPPPPDSAARPAAAVGAWGYRSYREHLSDRFGALRIRKLCLNAGFTCPNLDGTVATGGCAYCDNRGFVPRAADASDLRRQWDAGRAALRRRHRRVDGFIAYFQAFSNTHGSPDRLRVLYDPLPALLPECVGVAIGTRPDCLGAEVLPVLDALAERTFLTVEIGLQSDRDAVLRGLNRGHDAAAFHAAIARCAGRGFELCVHLILGLPGEGADAPERLGDLIAGLPVQSVKLHNLHALQGTALGRAHQRGLLPMPDAEAHRAALGRLLPRLRPDQAVQRLIADAPDHLLASDPWCQDKQGFLRRLQHQRANHNRAFHAA